MIHLSDQLEEGEYYNLVKDAALACSNAIHSGNLKVYLGPNKQKELSAENIADLERSANVSFDQSNSVYLFELWNIKGKHTTVETIGLLFSFKEEGRTVGFGFVDYQDVINLFDAQLMRTGIEGCSNVSLNQVLANREFEYEIVSYRDQPVSKLRKGDKLKSTFFEKYTYQSEREIKCDAKNLTFELLPSSGDLTAALCHSVSSYLYDNPLEYLNSCYNIDGHLFYSTDKIRAILYTEQWKLLEDSIILERPRNMTIIMESGCRIGPLSPSKIRDLPLRINHMDLVDLLRELQNGLRLIKINEEYINPLLTPKYLELLNQGRWDELKELKQNRI